MYSPHWMFYESNQYVLAGKAYDADWVRDKQRNKIECFFGSDS